jgi:recombination protein RecT
MGRLAGAMLMAAVTALPAASAIILREPFPRGPFEVLMIERHEKSSFVPSAWVFPGGTVEPQDAELARHASDGSTQSLTLATMRIAAVRETFEECGIWLGARLDRVDSKRRRLLAGDLSIESLLAESPVDLDRLIWTSRWITPVGVPKRFDAYFFLVRAPEWAAPSVDQNEAVDMVWIRPSDALARHADRAMHMVFPTLRNLESVAAHATIEALMEARRDAIIEPIQPIIVDGRIQLPD